MTAFVTKFLQHSIEIKLVTWTVKDGNRAIEYKHVGGQRLPSTRMMTRKMSNLKTHSRTNPIWKMTAAIIASTDNRCRDVRYRQLMCYFFPESERFHSFDPLAKYFSEPHARHCSTQRHWQNRFWVIGDFLYNSYNRYDRLPENGFRVSFEVFNSW